jgi:hypothetical protein
MPFNSEPELVFLNSPGSRSFFLGICAGYAVIFIRSLLNHKPAPRHQITFPCIGGFSLFLIVKNLSSDPLCRFDSIVQSLTAFLDFPVSFIEAVLTVRLICFISRLCLNTLSSPPRVRTPGVLPERTTAAYRAAISAISIATATTAFVFLLYGASRYNVTAYLGIAVAIVIASVVATLLCDNGIISDSCLVLLRTSLSLAPVLSYSSGEVTWWLRTLCVLIAFVSLLWELDSAGKRLPAVGVVVRVIRRGESQFRRKCAGRSLAGILIAYVFLSPGAFLTPKPRICGWQAIIIPSVYLAILANEAGYFHIAVTPAPRAGPR